MKNVASEHFSRPMLAFYWIGIAVLSVGGLFFEYVFGAIFFFTHGWANGWPVRFAIVASAGVAVYSALMMMTVAAGAGAILGFFCALCGVRQSRQFRAYMAWLLLAAVVVLCISWVRFRSEYLWWIDNGEP
jgi:hypothetical protein